MDWWKKCHYFFPQGSRAFPLLCNLMWSGGTWNNFHHMSSKILLLGSHREVMDVPHPQLNKDSGLRQKRSEKLPILLLCLKWKKKICHWSLLVHHFPLQLPLSSLAFLVWDKYRWRVVAPLLLLTQRITFIYCHDYTAICCVFTTWLCVVIDMFATWGLDVCKWTFSFHVCIWKSDGLCSYFSSPQQSWCNTSTSSLAAQENTKQTYKIWGVWDLQFLERIENYLVHIVQSTWSSGRLLEALSGPVLCMGWTG